LKTQLVDESKVLTEKEFYRDGFWARYVDLEKLTGTNLQPEKLEKLEKLLEPKAQASPWDMPVRAPVHRGGRRESGYGNIFWIAYGYGVQGVTAAPGTDPFRISKPRHRKAEAHGEAGGALG
jgi:hypothetical protein